MMTRKLPILTVGILLLCASAGAAAQETTMYVTDIVQLGLHHSQDTSDTAFRNVVSGTPLTVLERVPNYARVRTADGDEGWVRSFYLIAEKPAQLRVAELEAEVERLQGELAEAIAARDAAAGETEKLISEAESEIGQAISRRATVDRLEQENADLTSRVALYRGALPWPWVVGALVVTLVAGFAAGYWWLEASIRRRYGGFRMI
jgi:hypothetical protein